MEFVTKSASETKKLGQTFANNLKGGEILALSGNLGSGKTTFVQGFAKGLGITGRIISPTFILMRKYNVKLKIPARNATHSVAGGQNSEVKNFYHVDLYRLEENIENEVVNIGLTDIWGRGENVVVIEWAEKIKRLIPKRARWITFENLGGDKRKIVIS